MRVHFLYILEICKLFYWGDIFNTFLIDMNATLSLSGTLKQFIITVSFEICNYIVINYCTTPIFFNFQVIA